MRSGWHSLTFVFLQELIGVQVLVPCGIGMGTFRLLDFRCALVA